MFEANYPWKQTSLESGMQSWQQNNEANEKKKFPRTPNSEKELSQSHSLQGSSVHTISESDLGLLFSVKRSALIRKRWRISKCETEMNLILSHRCLLSLETALLESVSANKVWHTNMDSSAQKRKQRLRCPLKETFNHSFLLFPFIWCTCRERNSTHNKSFSVWDAHINEVVCSVFCLLCRIQG